MTRNIITIALLSVISGYIGWWTGKPITQLDLPIEIRVRTPNPLFEEYREITLRSLTSSNACESAFEETLAISSRALRHVSLRKTIEAWVAIDPQQAFDRCHPLASDIDTQYWFPLEICLTEWSKIDPESAFNNLWRFPRLVRYPHHSICVTKVFDVYAHAHLNTLLERIESGEFSGQQGNPVRALALAILAESDPNRAITLASPWTVDLQLILNQWTRSDPMSAFEWATNRDPQGRDQMMAHWHAASPQSALDFLKTRLSNGESIWELGRSIVSKEMSGGASQANEIATWIELLPSGLSRRKLMIHGAGSLVPHDPSRALQWLDELPREDRWYTLHENTPSVWPRHAIKVGFARAYAQKDLEAALTWAESLQEPSHRAVAMEEALSLLLKSDPTRVGILLNKHFIDTDDTDYQSGKTLTNVFNQWQMHNQPQAIAWVGEQPPPIRKQLDLRAPDSGHLTDHVRTRPMESLKDILALPQEEARFQILRSAINKIALNDLTAAEEAARSLPTTADRQHAAVELAYLLPIPQAWQIAISNRNPTLRDEAVSTVIWRIAGRDPKLARQRLSNLRKGKEAHNRLGKLLDDLGHLNDYLRQSEPN
jgi:hypothetical protein